MTTVPHTLAGFTASFTDQHKRHPTLQEIFDAGMKAGRDLQHPQNAESPKAKEQSDPKYWLSPETVMLAVKNSGLVAQYSCCDIPLKFCNTDMWRGELRSFSISLIRLAMAYVEKQKQETATEYFLTTYN